MKDVIFEIGGQFVNAREISHTRTAITPPGEVLYLIMKNGDAIFVASGRVGVSVMKGRLKKVFATYADTIDLGKAVEENDETQPKEAL